MARGAATARAAPTLALAVAALAILPGALGLVLPIEHSFDGHTFFKAGAIAFGDELLVKQRGVGTYERPPLSAEEVSAAKAAVEQGGRYFVRAFDDSIPADELPLASVPAAAWAAAGGAPALSLSLLSHGGVGAIAIDGKAAAPGAAAFPSDERLGRSAVSRTSLSFPEASNALRGAAAAAAPGGAAGQGAPASPAAATGPLGGAAAAAGPGAAASDETGTPAPRDESEMTPEERKAAEQRRKKEEWDKKSWIEKNWMMLIPAGLMFVNRWLSSLAQPNERRGQGQAAPART